MDKEFKPLKFSLFTQDGKKLAEGTSTNCLNTCGDIPKNMNWKLPDNFSCEFDVRLTEKNKEEMKVIEDLLYKDIDKQLCEFYKKVEKMVEIILRNYVTPPIKGEVTKGKVRWRGLQLVWQKTNTYDAFVGVRQRDVLILPNGQKIPWNSLVKIED